MVGSLKTSDVVLAFFTKHATEALFGAFAGVFEATKKAVAAVPADYAKYVEQKAVQSLKSTMFNRQTHQNGWTAFLWPTVSCRTGCYPHWFRFHWVLFYLTNHHACQEQDIIKNCAHILTPRQLAGLKEHEEDVKRLKLSTTTVHCVNMIVRKMASKSARERSALARELFGLLSSCYVCRCFLFLVGTHCF